VGLLALIAGTVSYLHMRLLVELHGQPGWVAALTPLSVDGMIVAASTTLLADSRAGSVAGFCHRPGCSIRRGRRQPVDASQNCNQLPPALPHKADRFMR
jgi:hypothetical protein